MSCKKMKGESAEAKRRRWAGSWDPKRTKESQKYLFLRIFGDLLEPYAIMMEHACFVFTPFGVDK